MINELLLENFKLFGKETHLAGLKCMNLLTGVNGRGKSSALQPLLLFKQTLLRSRSSRQVFLSGSFVDLGNASDVKHVDASVTKPIRIGFKDKDEQYIYSFGVASDNNQALDIKKFESTGKLRMTIDVDETTNFHDLVPETGKTEKLVLPFQDVIYISAERIGPKMSFAPSSDEWIDKRGEHTIQMLYERQYEKVDDRIIEGTTELFQDIDDYVSNLKANGATVTSPIEDADIGNIHGKKVEIQKGKDDRETIHYLDTEKGLLRIVYSVYDSNMFEGEDWETNRCYTCQKEFFDSLKENTGEQKQDARANEDNFVNPDSHEENMAEQGQDAQVKEESFEYRAIKQLCSDWSFTDAVLEDHYHVNKSDLEDSEIPVFKANEDGSYTLTLIDGEEYAGTWEVLPEEYYEEMDGILYFYLLSIDGNASDEEGIVITAQIGNEGVDESGNAHQLLVSFGVDETIQKVYAFEK